MSKKLYSYRSIVVNDYSSQIRSYLRIVNNISQEEVVEHYKILLSVIKKDGSQLLEYPEVVPAVEAPRYSWVGFYFDQGELKHAELHKNMCMTDISSKDDTVNGLYEWMETVR